MYPCLQESLILNEHTKIVEIEKVLSRLWPSSISSLKFYVVENGESRSASHLQVKNILGKVLVVRDSYNNEYTFNNGERIKQLPRSAIRLFLDNIIGIACLALFCGAQIAWYYQEQERLEKERLDKLEKERLKKLENDRLERSRAIQDKKGKKGWFN